MASCVKSIPTKNYQNLIIVFQVTVDNVGDVFLRHCVCLSQLVSAQFALEMCLAARNHRKIHKKTSFYRSRSSKIIEFDGNQEPVYDFLSHTIIEMQRLIG